MDATLIKALQLVLSLSILVVLHEGGHFLFLQTLPRESGEIFSFLRSLFPLI